MSVEPDARVEPSIDKLRHVMLPLQQYCIATATIINKTSLIGPIPWGHSGPLCHALSLSWTSMRRRRATVPLATSGEWA